MVIVVIEQIHIICTFYWSYYFEFWEPGVVAAVFQSLATQLNLRMKAACETSTIGKNMPLCLLSTSTKITVLRLYKILMP